MILKSTHRCDEMADCEDRLWNMFHRFLCRLVYFMVLISAARDL